jgi:hypothetical protein
MATYTKYEKFVEDMWNKIHDLFGTTDTLKVALTNSAPNVATHTTLADVTQISAGTGYTSGGSDTQNDSTRTGGTVTMTGVDIVWTATGSMGALRYAVLYNDTPTSPADPLIAYWDYGSSVTLTTGETFTVDFGASIHTVT